MWKANFDKFGSCGAGNSAREHVGQAPGLRRPLRPPDILILLLLLWIGLHTADPKSTHVQFAYVGPGAGFAFLGSFLTLIAGFFLSVFSLLLWPFRMLWRLALRQQGFRHARIRKLIFLGLDGLDPNLTERFLAEGKLPNLARLKDQGGFRRLRTTFPALSPVAWFS